MSAATDDDHQPAPPPPGPYFTNWGPPDGPILYRDHSPSLGVYPSREATGFPIGAAYVTSFIPSRKGPAVVFRLIVGKVELDGEWICRAREFIRLGEAAEEL